MAINIHSEISRLRLALRDAKTGIIAAVEEQIGKQISRLDELERNLERERLTAIVVGNGAPKTMPEPLPDDTPVEAGDIIPSLKPEPPAQPAAAEPPANAGDPKE